MDIVLEHQMDVSSLRVVWMMTGGTPLHCAALGSQAGWLDASQAGLAKPAAPPKARLGHSSIATELLGQGVDPTALDDARCSALHYASGADLQLAAAAILKAVASSPVHCQPCMMRQASKQGPLFGVWSPWKGAMIL